MQNANADDILSKTRHCFVFWLSATPQNNGLRLMTTKTRETAELNMCITLRTTACKLRRLCGSTQRRRPKDLSRDTERHRQRIRWRRIMDLCDIVAITHALYDNPPCVLGIILEYWQTIMKRFKLNFEYLHLHGCHGCVLARGKLPRWTKLSFGQRQTRVWEHSTEFLKVSPPESEDGHKKRASPWNQNQTRNNNAYLH